MSIGSKTNSNRYPSSHICLVTSMPNFPKKLSYWPKGGIKECRWAHLGSEGLSQTHMKLWSTALKKLWSILLILLWSAVLMTALKCFVNTVEVPLWICCKPVIYEEYMYWIKLDVFCIVFLIWWWWWRSLTTDWTSWLMFDSVWMCALCPEECWCHLPYNWCSAPDHAICPVCH